MSSVIEEPSPNSSLTASLIRSVLQNARSEFGFSWEANEESNSPFGGYGAISSQGLSKHMEDSFHVQETLSSPGFAEPQALQQQATAAVDDGSVNLQGFTEDLAFFSVFDGHGGDEVAQHCSDRLHQHFTRLLLGELSTTTSLEDAVDANGSSGQPGLRSVIGKDAHDISDNAQASAQLPAGSLTPPARSSTQAQEPQASPQASDQASGAGGSRPCRPSLVSAALRESFHLTDCELAGTDEGEYVGATAVVAVVGRQHIWVAHCGDSRAVMQRSGDAVALTSDHKPDRQDEADRIKAAGGRIVFNGGARRVNGMLAMTRSIGDHYLRPYVIAEPEVVCLERTAEDEVLIIATDGLWDVFGCTEATNLASRCISRSKERGMSKHGACRVAASVLANTALERGSRDNITVIVVDVSLPPADSESGLDGRPEPVVASSAQDEVAEVSTARGSGTGEGEDGSGDGTGRAAGGAGGASMLMRSSTSMGKYMLLKSQSRADVGSAAAGAGGGGSGPGSGGAGRTGLSAVASSPRQTCSHADLTRLCQADHGEEGSAQRQRSVHMRAEWASQATCGSGDSGRTAAVDLCQRLAAAAGAGCSSPAAAGSGRPSGLAGAHPHGADVPGGVAGGVPSRLKLAGSAAGSICNATDTAGNLGSLSTQQGHVPTGGEQGTAQPQSTATVQASLIGSALDHGAAKSSVTAAVAAMLPADARPCSGGGEAPALPPNHHASESVMIGVHERPQDLGLARAARESGSPSERALSCP